MLISAFFFLIFANVVNHSKGIKQDVKTAFLFLVYFWIILIFTFRGTEVPDTQNYIKSYYGLAKSVKFEYLYTLICQIANVIGLSFNGFLLVLQLVLFSLWFHTSSKFFSDVHLAFLVFIPFMGIYNFGIIIRSGIGLCLCYYAITYLLYHRSLKGYIIYYAILTASIFFQQSMIVFLILPLYVFKRYNSVVLSIILIFSILIPLLNIQHLIANFLEVYIKLFSFDKFLSYTRIHAKFDIHGVYSLTMIKYWIMSIIFILFRSKITSRKEMYNCFINIYITGVFLIALTHFISAGNRLAYLFFFFEFVIVIMLYEYSSLPRKIVLLGAIALCVLNYLNLISAIPVMISY